METVKKAYLRFFSVYAWVSDRLTAISMLLSYFLLVAVTAITVVGVFYRYILNSPLRWTEEVARYLLVWLALIAASIATKERQHISLALFIDRLPRKAALAIEIILSLLTAVVLGILVGHGWRMIMTRSLRLISPSLQVSMAWAHSAMPIGLGLILIQTVFVLLEDIKLLITHESIPSTSTLHTGTVQKGG